MNGWASESKALAIAQRYLRGEISPAEACRELSPWTHSSPECFSQSDRNFIIGVDSETDRLPVGKLRDLWHPDFLQPKLEELAQYERRIRQEVQGVCERLIYQLQTLDKEVR